jgi:phosphoribosylamine--glycine ligase
MWSMNLRTSGLSFWDCAGRLCAGTERDNSGRLVTAGGRVLSVTAIGRDLAAARDRAYEAVACIRWDGEHHRSDIAADAIAKSRGV